MRAPERIFCVALVFRGKNLESRLTRVGAACRWLGHVLQCLHLLEEALVPQAYPLP
jgi:hypothetical protein